MRELVAFGTRCRDLLFVLDQAVEICGDAAPDRGIWAETITQKTNYLIVAPIASRDWKATHFGGKIEKAQKYISDGAPLRFVPEHVFERALLLADGIG